MPKILVTGGTVFVSRYIAEYYVEKGYDVYVLNRNTKPQSRGVTLIQADRHELGDVLRSHEFDAVIDTAYNARDVELLLDALGKFNQYVLISSSAVYPEHAEQPFREDTSLSVNRYWGKYGTDKIEAEQALQKRVPHAYILRPPYLYGPMNNVYREAFVFECALADRIFCLPRDGSMQLQFFHIHDLCRFIDILFEKSPQQRIFNVGNADTVSVRDWVSLCYQAAGKEACFRSVYEDIDQRKYFSFYDYEYRLDVSSMSKIMENTIPLKIGLKMAFDWYIRNPDAVNKKAFIEFIDNIYLVSRNENGDAVYEWIPPT